MSDSFYSPRVFLSDRKVWMSAAISLVISIIAVALFGYWRVSNSVVVRPIVAVSLSPWDSDKHTQPDLSVEDIKKILETATKSGDKGRFVVYTASLSDFCKNKDGISTIEGTQFVIANTKTSKILGTISDSSRTCDVAAQSTGAANLLVTSSKPFPTAIASDKVVLSVAY